MVQLMGIPVAALTKHTAEHEVAITEITYNITKKVIEWVTEGLFNRLLGSFGVIQEVTYRRRDQSLSFQ